MVLKNTVKSTFIVVSGVQEEPDGGNTKYYVYIFNLRTYKVSLQADNYKFYKQLTDRSIDQLRIYILRLLIKVKSN